MRESLRTRLFTGESWHQTLIGCILILAAGLSANGQEALSPQVSVGLAWVNGVVVERNGHRLVVYGDPAGRWESADTVLFTHSRRDVVSAGRSLVSGGAEAIVPAGESEQFSKAEDFWSTFWTGRFHDYAQRSTRLPISSMPVGRAVRQGDSIPWQDLTVRVLDTPGYTRGAVSYFIDVDGVRYGFVGDLIYGDGRLLDLYSLQDAVSEARIGGYHGYAGRIGDLIASLRKVAAEKPNVLVPAHGPVVRDPAAAIERLIGRLQAAYENYLSISAGRWYFRDQYDTLAARVFGSADHVPWMPYAATIEKTPPDWVVPIQNSRLLVARDGSGLLIDCGSNGIIEEIRKLKAQGRLTSLDGLFITHYHDDHTEKVNDLLQYQNCPVYATPLMANLLRRPGDYRLPCLTPNAIRDVTVLSDGHRMPWKEFSLTFYDLPGQTIYHSALLAERDSGEKIFFIGDSFTPSGIDDYCLQNRNLLRPDTGFAYCLALLRNKIPKDALLVNEHVLEPFRFNEDQLRHMTAVLKRRTELLRELFPWDNPNYGLDEQWARIHPYGQEVKAGEWATIAVKILNHSPVVNAYTVALNVPQGFEVEPRAATLQAEPGREVEMQFRVKAAADSTDSIRVITADIRMGSWDLRQWCEALLRIAP
jgi:glyoxylase-like metal-dependent hydrolase (beta-lactamase superfamily II)